MPTATPAAASSRSSAPPPRCSVSHRRSAGPGVVGPAVDPIGRVVQVFPDVARVGDEAADHDRGHDHGDADEDEQNDDGAERPRDAMPLQPADERRRDRREHAAEQHRVDDHGGDTEDPDDADEDRGHPDEQPRHDADVAEPPGSGEQTAPLDRVRLDHGCSPAIGDGFRHHGADPCRPAGAWRCSRPNSANIRSCRRRDRPPRRRRLVLRVGGAAGRPAAARPAGDCGAGVVLAASYEAKAYGVRTAMGGARARRLCPHAAVVPPRFSAYLEASRALFAVFEDARPVVEGLSIDEAFLDVRGMRHRGTPVEIARRSGSDVRRTGRATRHGRGREDEVPRQGGERCREARRPARRAAGSRAGLPAPAPGRAALGCRPATADKLHDRGIGTVGEVARLTGGGARVHARPCLRPPPPRSRPQPRPPVGQCGPPARLDRVTAGARALGRRRPPTSMPRGRPGRPRHTPDAGSRAASAAPSCSASGSTTSHGRRGRTRFRARPPQTQSYSARRGHSSGHRGR